MVGRIGLFIYRKHVLTQKPSQILYRMIYLEIPTQINLGRRPGASSLKKLDLVGQILYAYISPDRLTWFAPKHGRAHHSSWSLHARA